MTMRARVISIQYSKISETPMRVLDLVHCDLCLAVSYRGNA